MNKNIIIILLIISLGITGYIAFQNKKSAKNTNLTQVSGIDWNIPFEKNITLEEIYNKSNNTVMEHTVCIPAKKFRCDAVSCESNEPKVFNLISGTRENPVISRCDDKGCDDFESIIDDSGEYKNIQPRDPKGFIFKMSYNTLDKKFVEITTIGLDTFISYGYCNFRQ